MMLAFWLLRSNHPRQIADSSPLAGNAPAPRPAPPACPGERQSLWV